MSNRAAQLRRVCNETEMTGFREQYERLGAQLRIAVTEARECYKVGDGDPTVYLAALRALNHFLLNGCQEDQPEPKTSMENNEGFTILENWKIFHASLFLMRGGKDIRASGPVHVLDVDRQGSKLELETDGYRPETVDLVGALMEELPAPQTPKLEQSPYSKFLQISFADKSEWLLAGSA